MELIQQIREIEGVSGVHVMAYRQEEAVAEIIDASGVLEGGLPGIPAKTRDRTPTCEEGYQMTDTVVSSASKRW